MLTNPWEIDSKLTIGIFIGSPFNQPANSAPSSMVWLILLQPAVAKRLSSWRLGSKVMDSNPPTADRPSNGSPLGPRALC